IPYRREEDLRAAMNAAIIRVVHRGGGPLVRPQPHGSVVRAAPRSGVGRDRKIEALHQLLRAPDPFQRELAAELLGENGNATSIPKLAAALFDKHPGKTSGSISSGGLDIWDSITV